MPRRWLMNSVHLSCNEIVTLGVLTLFERFRKNPTCSYAIKKYMIMNRRVVSIELSYIPSNCPIASTR